MPYAIKALALILEAATDPVIVNLAQEAIETAFAKGDISEEDYQASIKARDEAWERVKAARSA